ncbi:hypothetical protein JQ609_05615 [Bradyrhizobium sp. AUGA SZCCT0169]|uniref:hypothetical protein n=1 Tax=unclassified Bradyrhizobium TaxID=2631580 RepID=UPI001BA9DA28|nr:MULTISPECIES: hypothetical protein [unclassified Bradyrhizobium]MBR1189850.1 hypothetical protein [Bradyrhizobium sp. AUGA SZCCT0160]MBR1246408.1 hypothetical protein [Bradyrhizobium sp. AUGA SZCCT0169]
MPVPQQQVRIREDRFTVPLGRTITIATPRISRAPSSAETEDLVLQKFPQWIGRVRA